MLAKKGEFMAWSTLFHNMLCVYITGRAVFFINILIEALYANAPKLVVPFADIALAYIIKRYSKKVKIHFNLKVPQNTRTVGSIYGEEVNSENWHFLEWLATRLLCFSTVRNHLPCPPFFCESHRVGHDQS